MFKTYLILALRNAIRHWGYALLNIFGLAIGMACCALIFLWVVEELSYDRFHANADRIYRVTNRLQIGNMDRSAATTMAPAGPAMVEDIPEISTAVRFSIARTLRVKYQDRQFIEDGAYYADNSVFEVFSFGLISGDPRLALTEPYSTVITQEVAHRYFGQQDPIGKILQIDGADEFVVTGILQEVPQNSHLRFDMLLSFQTLYSRDRELLSMWNRLAYFTYILLPENVDFKQVEQKLPALIDKYLGKILASRGAVQELFLQPLKEIHLKSNLERDSFAEGDITNVYLFSSVALLVLLIACFNFVNLVTARSATRAGEVAMRRIFGAQRRQLIQQFIGEAVMLFIFSMVIGLGLMNLALPAFNELTGLDFSVSDLMNPSFLLGAVVGALIIGTMAGAYPALYLSSLKPTNMFRHAFAQGRGKGILRRVLIVVQSATLVALIISTLVIYNQISYMKNQGLGFDHRDLVVLPDITDPSVPPLDILRNELIAVEGVVGVTTSSSVPGRGGMVMSVIPEGFSDNNAMMLTAIRVDADFIPVLGMELVQGRNFSKNIITDTAEAIIINETAVALFGWNNPIGKNIRRVVRRPSGTDFVTKKVIGVVRDFHNESLHSKIGPVMLENSADNLTIMSMRVESGALTGTLNRFETKWSELAPDYPIDYIILQEDIETRYNGEGQLAHMTTYFSLLAITVACLGLLSITAFSVERRGREIAVRKVLGATVFSILELLYKELLVLVLAGITVAIPLSYFVINRWLSSFAYQATFGWEFFVISVVITIVITGLTVSIQTARAALANPVDSLRCE
ncbi:MAG: ABC transporter permease [candidate division Zixibacteria bacterium]